MNKYFANVVLTFTEKLDLATLIKDLELNTPKYFYALVNTANL